MELELAPRLNLLTGDNGLGKSFLLTWPGGHWHGDGRNEVNPRLTSGYVAQPRSGKLASITYRVRSKKTLITHTSEYRRAEQPWIGKRGRPHSPGLVIYATPMVASRFWEIPRATIGRRAPKATTQRRSSRPSCSLSTRSGMASR